METLQDRDHLRHGDLYLLVDVFIEQLGLAEDVTRMAHDLPDLLKYFHPQCFEVLDLVFLRRQSNLKLIYLLLNFPVCSLQGFRILLLKLLQFLYNVSGLTVTKELRSSLDDYFHL